MSRFKSGHPMACLACLWALVSRAEAKVRFPTFLRFHALLPILDIQTLCRDCQPDDVFKTSLSAVDVPAFLFRFFIFLRKLLPWWSNVPLVLCQCQSQRSMNAWSERRLFHLASARRAASIHCPRPPQWARRKSNANKRIHTHRSR